MSTIGSGEAVHVASLDEWTLDMRTDKTDVSSFQDTNKQYVQGLADVQGTFAGNWDDAVKTPWIGRKSTTAPKFYLYPNKTSVPTKYAYGTAWLDMSIRVQATGKATVSASFAAAGNWGDTFGV
jgi:hypothetical protein